MDLAVDSKDETAFAAAVSGIPCASNDDEDEKLVQPISPCQTIRDVFDRTLESLSNRESVVGSTGLRDKLSDQQQLDLYGRYKVALQQQQNPNDDSSSSPPPIWQYKAYAKYNAWKQCSVILTPEMAMQEYVQIIHDALEPDDPLVVSIQEWFEQIKHNDASRDHDNCNDHNVKNNNKNNNDDDNEKTTKNDAVSITDTLTHENMEKHSKASLVAKTNMSQNRSGETLNVTQTMQDSGRNERSYVWDLIDPLFAGARHVLDSVSMIPRGQIDIGNADLFFAACSCLTESRYPSQFVRSKFYQQQIADQWKSAIVESHRASKPDAQEEKCSDSEVLVGLSVRTMLDLYLRVRRYPPGSEIIVTPALNVPGMIQVLEYHQIHLVGIDLPCDKAQHPLMVVDVDAVEAAITSRTVAILVVHVFGIITANADDMHRLRDIANSHNHNIDILEDCAQAFGGLSPPESTSYLGSPLANISFFSFGPIKTTTALGGGVAVFHKNLNDTKALFQSMKRMHDTYSMQTNMQFLFRIAKFGILRNIAASPVLYGMVFGILHNILGLDFDRIVTSLIRGFNVEPKNITAVLRKIRQRPCSAQLVLLRRRFSQTQVTAKLVHERVLRFQNISTLLQKETGLTKQFTSLCTGVGDTSREETSLWWLYPVTVEASPDLTVKCFQRNGLDATTGASQLCCVPSVNKCPTTNHLMQKILYLPKSDNSIFPNQMTLALRKSLTSIQSKPANTTIRQIKSSHTLLRFSFSSLFIFRLILFILRKNSLVSGVTHVYYAALFVVLTLTIILWLVRWFMGTYYLHLSSGFAKYSQLIDNVVSSADDVNAKHSQTASNDILSKLKVLELVGSLNTSKSKGSVFLTGCTGFVGSMILRDILFFRRQLNIDHVILLCRNKRGVSGRDRVAALLSQSMFSFLSEIQKAEFVEVIEGDATLPSAGLDNATIERIRNMYDISHVIHCAATVSFMQSFPAAARSNITSSLGVQRLASEIAKKKKAKFVYISTAFVHGGLSGSKAKPLTEELFSFGNFDPQKIYASMKTTQYYASEAMAELCFPNTYAFSKSVCEHLLLQNDPDTLIFRPSIVGPAVEVPYEGWAGKFPSTLIAAACLYLRYQWNLWSFGPHRVPCIPVDILSRFVIAKSFENEMIDQVESECLSESSSDDGFQKVQNCPTSSSKVLVTCSPKFCKIYNVAWDAKCHDNTFFTWLDFAGAVTQVGAVLGYFDRVRAYIGLLLASRLLPKASLSVDSFERLHTWFVRYPVHGMYFLARSIGMKVSDFETLRKYLDLPLLFFPFMNSEFHFSSELTMPSTMNGERYAVVCVAAAHSFLKKSSRGTSKGASTRSTLSFLSIGGSNCESSSGFLWSLMQPQGNFLARFAAWILGKVLQKCYSNVTVDIPSFSGVRYFSQKGVRGCIVLAPTHRSFFDFLLLSYLFFSIPELQIKMPKIAAAEEFRRLPILGYLIQCLGCFFVHRGRMVPDPKLSKTLEKIQDADGTVIEIFIEGTRSRDRRFVRPKTGVLRCLWDAQGDYLILPISISHERIAEQEHLSEEAAGERRSALHIQGIFSWLAQVLIGKIRLGQVHIKACNPLEIANDREIDWRLIVNEIQRRQVKNILLSDYHVEATEKLLHMEPDEVKEALAVLGGTFLPQCLDHDPSLKPHVGISSQEWLPVFLQTAPLLAPLFSDSHPEWAKWLFYHTNATIDQKTYKISSVNYLFNSASKLFDEADQCVEKSIAMLKEQGYRSPSQSHIFQVSCLLCPDSPKLLLKAASMKKYVCNCKEEVSVNEGGTASIDFSQIKLRSEETLGFWGFHDAGFVARVDRSGQPFVILKGKQYSMSGTKNSKLIPFIESELGVKVNFLHEAFIDSRTNKATLPCSLTDGDIEFIRSLVSTSTTSFHERMRHGLGHSQQDIFCVREGLSVRVPDIVIWPETEAEVVDVVAAAKTRNWCIIPYGGGTNVSQAIRCPPINVEPRPIISLDLQKMNKIHWVDEENKLAFVDSGITGRKLEEELGRRGFTMGHEPDSIEFSTLGGWIATKASGMKRNKYGNIEDMVKAVRVVGPDGVLEHGRKNGIAWGRESAGVDLPSIVFGSEGCLGVITSAVIRVWPVAQVKDYDSVLLVNFDEGLRFIRELSELGKDLPVSVRLLDNAHFRLGLALRPDKEVSISSVLRTSYISLLLWKRGFHEKEVVCVTITYEGSAKEVSHQKRVICRIANRHGAVRLGSTIGQAGYNLTFMIAYLRDFALTYHVLGESFETFAPWTKVDDIIHRTKDRIFREHSSRLLPGRPFVGSRVTQLYHEGVCIYFYFCMSFEGVENASNVFAEIEHAARAEILAAGGSLSHHHGIGKIRSDFLQEINSAPLQRFLQSLKSAFDPDNIFGARNGPFGDT